MAMVLYKHDAKKIRLTRITLDKHQRRVFVKAEKIFREISWLDEQHVHFQVVGRGADPRSSSLKKGSLLKF